MKPANIADCGCSAWPAVGRCDADLPDSPQCAPNYHFGMLLGVDDFRAEQGFQLGHLRRHQRLLHGSGVVAGYQVTFRPDDFEVRVGPGYAVDALGRDLVLDTPQCVSLPRWWVAHRGDDAFHDVATPDDATLDLDVMVCYACCLDRPVPAIAEPCAGDAADIAYSRVCETVRLALVRAPETPAAAAVHPFHLLQMWLGLAGPRTDGEGKTLDSDQWLLDRIETLQALPPADQAGARADLLRELIARAVAENAPQAPVPDAADEMDFCLLLARLHDVHLKLDPDGWKASVGAVEMGVRAALLPTALLQTLVLTDPPPLPAAAGPVVIAGGATLAGQQITLVFSQPLAQMSVKLGAFAVSEFVEAQGWKPFTLDPPTYDASDPTRPSVTLGLDRAPVGALVRVTVFGDGGAPLLGANLIPAGAMRPDGEGRTLSTSIRRG